MRLPALHRGAPALHEILTAPCGEAGSGRRKTAATLAFEALRVAGAVARQTPGAGLTIVAAPAVLAALEGPAGRAKAELEGRLGVQLGLEATRLAEGQGYEVIAAPASAAARPVR